MKAFKTALVILGLSSSLQAMAKSGGVLNCWDHTFAYNTATATPNSGNPDTLLNVSLKSENQSVYDDLLPSPHESWGEMNVSFVLNKANCKTQPNRPDLMDCVQKDGVITIAYTESTEAQRTVRWQIGTLHFSSALGNSTSANGIGSLVVNLSFTKKGQSDVHSASMGFMTQNDKCY